MQLGSDIALFVPAAWRPGLWIIIQILALFSPLPPKSESEETIPITFNQVIWGVLDLPIQHPKWPIA
jgi:hypothetical protein